MNTIRGTTLKRAMAILLLFVALLVALPGAILAAGPPIYDSIPAAYPGSFPSLGYEATSTDEFGDHIEFTAAGETLDNAVISLTDWACENDYALGGPPWVADRLGTEACETTPGSGFDHDITLTLYEVDNTGPDPAVGPVIATKTGTFFIPFRPSYDSTNCITGSGKAGALSPADDVPFGGTWYSAADDRCFHGYAFNITFDFAGDNVVLPDEVIFGIAYNTSSSGAVPLGAVGPYSSLNVSVNSVGPTVGTDVELDAAFWDTSFAPNYADGGAGGVDIFRRDTGWTGFYPVVQFNSASAQYFFSTTVAGTTGDGLDFGPEDIIQWDGSAWSMWFDGSAAGLTPVGAFKHNINAFWIEDAGDEDVVMSFAQNARVVPDITTGKVDGMDLVKWDGDEFSLYFDGSDVGLTNKTQEKIDALHILPGTDSPIGGSCDAYLLVSTQGPGRVPTGFGGAQLRFAGEDVLGFCLTNSGSTTTGFWHMVLDGSAQSMPKNATTSISMSEDGNTLYLTTKGTFNVDLAVGGHSSVYEYDMTTTDFSGPIFIAADNGLSKAVDGLQVD